MSLPSSRQPLLIGGAIGVNLWAGELLLKLKEEPGYEDLELAVILPFPGHDAKWDVRSRKRLEYLIRHSVEHLTVGTEDCRESYISQNRYLVDHAQYLVAVSGGAQGIRKPDRFR